MDAKVLPFKNSPVIGLLGHAYVLGILSNYEECLPWFYNNYIQLYFSRRYLEERGEFWLDFFPDLMVIFEDVPWLEYHRMDKETIFNNNIDLNKFIIDYINRGYYFFTCADEFFIPGKVAYNRLHFTHDIMVYGYNLEKKTYNIAGFGTHYMYKASEVSFEEFNLAFNNAVSKKNLISLLKKVEDFNKYKYDFRIGKYDFDIKLVVEMLSDYLYSRNSTERLGIYRNPDDDFFGMKIYEYLKMYLERLLDNKVRFDIKPIHILWEHKKCMLLRIKYMREKGFLNSSSVAYEGYMKIEKEVLMLRNAILKYQLSGSKDIIEKIIPSIRDIAAEENRVLEDLINEIRKTNSLH